MFTGLTFDFDVSVNVVKLAANFGDALNVRNCVNRNGKHHLLAFLITVDHCFVAKRVVYQTKG